MKISDDFNYNDLCLLINGIVEYLYNDKNICLVKSEINEKTVCGCIKEYLDKRFCDSNLSIDLEYNKVLNSYSKKELYGITIEKIRKNKFICDIISNEELIKRYIDKKKKDKDEKKEFDKRFIPDIIVHERNTNKNKLLFEVKKASNDYAKSDIVKLALIKKYSGLNYDYYIYFEYGLEKNDVIVYYLDNTKDNFIFKRII